MRYPMAVTIIAYQNCYVIYIRALGKVYTSTHNTCLMIHSLLSFTKVILYVQLQNRSDRETLTRNLKCWCW